MGTPPTIDIARDRLLSPLPFSHFHIIKMANNMTEDDRYAHITERRENKYNLFTELALQESKFGTNRQVGTASV
jgi:hypothetical protein